MSRVLPCVGALPAACIAQELRPGGTVPEAPWAFAGGTIRRAAVDVSGQPFVDLAAEARMAFMRD